MIGVYSEDFMVAHVYWSNVFFELNLFVLILAGLSMYTHPDYLKPIAFFGFAVAVINLLFVFVIGSPILEWFTVFTALGYVGLIVFNTYKMQVKNK